MILVHPGKSPQIHPSAYIAPTAALCGDVAVGAQGRVMSGAGLMAEGGSLAIGSDGIGRNEVSTTGITEKMETFLGSRAADPEAVL